MKFSLPILLLSFLLFSCLEKIPVDSIIYNANIYTVDSSFKQATFLAIKDGRFVAIGSKDEVLSSYQSRHKVDAKGKTILPGWIDAHCHFYGLGLMRQRVDLSGIQSFDDILQKVVAFQKIHQHDYILGEGWDQNLWEDNHFPNKALLDNLFPTTPVALRRVDGHALLVNQAALDLAKINPKTNYSGGKILQEDGELTGIIIDKPMELIFNSQPKPTREIQIEALKEAEQICFANGLTSVTDAGLDKEIILLIDSLQKVGALHIRVNAMVNYSPENFAYYINRTPIVTDQLQVNSFKIYADGSLGSRGACLKKPYSDQDGHYGQLLSNVEELEHIVNNIANSPYQLNCHAIGDSTNKVILELYQKYLDQKPNRRWRIEHAQVVAHSDYSLFNENIIPSVQPTHAISDMLWAEERLGSDRMQHAYAYADLLARNGIIALGTDFPIEKVDPRQTFHAAVNRRNTAQQPTEGFYKEQALTREQALKGMTIWAAYAGFEEKIKGSIEVGKLADFIFLDKDIMTIPMDEISKIKIEATYLSGDPVFNNQ